MRKTTSNLRDAIDESERCDDALAAKIGALIAFIERAERDRAERDNAIKTAIDQDRAAFLSATSQMKAELTACAAELKGSPVVDHMKIAAE